MIANIPASKKINVLLIDLPTYSVPIAHPYRELLARRLQTESLLREQRLGYSLRRSDLPYSRGLLQVGAYIQRAGHNVRYLVLADPQDEREFEQLCVEADVVGITAMTPVVQQAFRLFQQVKSLNPKALCVLGGPHASMLPEECLHECAHLDVVVPGAGESIFLDITSHLDHYKDVGGIYYREGSGVVRTKHSRTPVRTVVHPNYELLNRPLHEYAHNIRTFDGCPYQCSFCIERLSWQSKQSYNELDQVMNEILTVSRGSPAHTLIHFSDSVFTLNKERVLELCARLEKLGLPLCFSCDTRVDLLDRQVLEAMWRAGFVLIRLGVESMIDAILDDAKKGTSEEKNLEAVKLIRETTPQMLIHAYALTGLPGSTEDTFVHEAHNIQFLIENDLVDIIGNKVLVPYPGTPYFTEPDKYGITINHRRWESYDRLSLPVFKTRVFSEYELYFRFLTLESIQQKYYEVRLSPNSSLDFVNPASLDYVFRSYIKNKGLEK